MVDSITHQKECFSSVYVDDIYAYFGTQSGALCIYHLNTLSLSAIYPYLYSLRKKYLLTFDGLAEGMSGPPINRIFKSRSPRLLQSWATCWLGLMLMEVLWSSIVKRRRLLSSSSAMHRKWTHFMQIESIKWIRGKKDSFLSCSSDGLVIIWDLVNDKWTPHLLDVSNKLSMYAAMTAVTSAQTSTIQETWTPLNQKKRSSTRNSHFQSRLQNTILLRTNSWLEIWWEISSCSTVRTTNSAENCI